MIEKEKKEFRKEMPQYVSSNESSSIQQTNEWKRFNEQETKEMTKRPRFSTDENLPVWSTRHESNTKAVVLIFSLWTLKEKESKQTSYCFSYFWFRRGYKLLECLYPFLWYATSRN